VAQNLANFQPLSLDVSAAASAKPGYLANGPLPFLFAPPGNGTNLPPGMVGGFGGDELQLDTSGIGGGPPQGFINNTPIGGGSGSGGGSGGGGGGPGTGGGQTGQLTLAQLEALLGMGPGANSSDINAKSGGRIGYDDGGDVRVPGVGTEAQDVAMSDPRAEISHMGLFSGNKHGLLDLACEIYRQTRDDPSFAASVTGLPSLARGAERVQEPGVGNKLAGTGEIAMGALPLTAGTRIAEPLFSTGLRTFATLATPQALQDIGSGGPLGSTMANLFAPEEAQAQTRQVAPMGGHLSPAQEEMNGYLDQKVKNDAAIKAIMDVPMPHDFKTGRPIDYKTRDREKLRVLQQSDREAWDAQQKRKAQQYIDDNNRLAPLMDKTQGQITEEGNQLRSFRVNHPVATGLMQLGGEFLPMAVMSRVGYTQRTNLRGLIDRYDTGLAANTPDGARAAAAAQAELTSILNPTRLENAIHYGTEFGGSSLTAAFMNTMPDVLDLRSPNPQVKQEAWDRLVSKDNLETLGLLIAFGGVAGPAVGEKAGSVVGGPANWQRSRSISQAPPPWTPPPSQPPPPPNPLTDLGPREYGGNNRGSPGDRAKDIVRSYLAGRPIQQVTPGDLEGALARQNMRYPQGSPLPGRLQQTQQKARDEGKRSYTASEISHWPGTHNGRQILSVPPIIAAGLSAGDALLGSEERDQGRTPPTWPQTLPGEHSLGGTAEPHASGGRSGTSAGTTRPQRSRESSLPPDEYRRGGIIGRALQIAKRYAAGGAVHEGPITERNDGGRTDTYETDVRQASYVVPSDIVSALGQGDTNAGYRVLTHMFGPHAPGHAAPGERTVPIVAAGGEFIIGPEAVARVGRGDIKAGHDALDAWVRVERRKNIQKLRRLPGPSRD
jgi:hypothetical protein